MTLHNFEEHYPNDKRPRLALEAAEARDPLYSAAYANIAADARCAGDRAADDGNHEAAREAYEAMEACRRRRQSVDAQAEQHLALDLEGIKTRIRDSRLTEMGIIESAGMDTQYQQEMRHDRLDARRRLWEEDAPDLVAEVERLRAAHQELVDDVRSWAENQAEVYAEMVSEVEDWTPTIGGPEELKWLLLAAEERACRVKK